MTLFSFDREIRQKQNIPMLAGVDEAGRGPLAGPVVAAAVVLPADFFHKELNDSKKVSEKKRKLLYDVIVEQALDFSIQWVAPEEIDEMNILNATMLTMKRCIETLKITPELALIDGNKTPDSTIPTLAIVKGDGISASIAAASILAKVTRDEQMVEYHKKYPEFGFHQHKGYPTKAHYQAISQVGITKIHRRSYLKKVDTFLYEES